jgi:hypothetical protein
MKNECRGSGFSVHPSRSFLEPGDRTECSWCHRTVPVTRSLQLRAHSVVSAPATDGFRRALPTAGPRRLAQPRG